MNQKINEIENEINSLILDLLGPIRSSKIIDKTTFNKFYSLLNEVKQLMGGEVYIPRKLVGMLFYIYRTIAAESEHAKYSEPIFIATAKIETYLDEILWDSPWK